MCAANPVDLRAANQVDCSKVVVKPSEFGHGAFAAVDIREGEEVERGLVRRIPVDGHKSQFVFTWSEDRTVWACASGTSAYFNTAAVPNTHMERFYDEDRFEIVALRDIKAGEELTHKYKSLAWREAFEDIKHLA